MINDKEKRVFKYKGLAIPNLKGCREVIKYSGLYVIDEKKKITYNKKTGVIKGVKR